MTNGDLQFEFVKVERLQSNEHNVRSKNIIKKIYIIQHVKNDDETVNSTLISLKKHLYITRTV